MEVAQPLDNSASTKRRKVGSNGDQLRLPSSIPERITPPDSDDVIHSSKNLSNSVENNGSTSSDINISASCCSVNSDLEETGETRGTVLRCNLSRRESFPLQQQLKTSTLSTNSMAEKPPMMINRVPLEKTPPAAELEEFFAAAEKKIQKQFKEKYNYDVVKDVPLKGRFEWIELKP
ncbi:hypothetical protein M8C21_030822 [Ambrosia artemisiifolia]|uniref:Cyclin-dependent kinase inhibitor domain-containing protein n=1 Tax=Ambrosia artemisiifolia TaxID=4212 RepID=A0AAD5C694_AMBAR|nr:hypothetical protein M8C21_030822 [Ambrosia artemisiifolia]